MHEGVLLCYVTTPLLWVAMLDLDQLRDFPGAHRAVELEFSLLDPSHFLCLLRPSWSQSLAAELGGSWSARFFQLVLGRQSGDQGAPQACSSTTKAAGDMAFFLTGVYCIPPI